MCTLHMTVSEPHALEGNRPDEMRVSRRVSPAVRALRSDVVRRAASRGGDAPRRVALPTVMSISPTRLEWRLKIVLPFSRCHAAPDRFWYTFQLGAAAPASIRHGGASIRARLATREPEASALMRPAHKLHSVFDVPPVFG